MSRKLIWRAGLLFGVLIAAGCRDEPAGPMLVGGRDLDSWIRRLDDPDASKRREAVRKIGNAGELAASTRAALAKRLRDADPRVRREAVFTLGKAADLSDALVSELKTIQQRDPNADVRASAAQALAKTPRIE